MALSGRTVLLILSGWLGGLPVIVDAQTLVDNRSEVMELDASRSNATFSVRVLWMIDVDGVFGSVHGHVEIDPLRKNATVDARIDANAVAMRRPGTENWVKSPEFFNVAEYPEIRFQSQPFPLDRLRSGGDLPGMLSLRGVTAPIVFRLMPSNCEHPAIDCPVQAMGTLKRGAFGMRSRKGTLAEKVELGLSIRVRTSEPRRSDP